MVETLFEDILKGAEHLLTGGRHVADVRRRVTAGPDGDKPIDRFLHRVQIIGGVIAVLATVLEFARHVGTVRARRTGPAPAHA